MIVENIFWFTEKSQGLPEKTSTSSSERSKRRKTEELRLHDVENLSYAAHMKLRASGKVHASNILKVLTQSTTQAYKYRSVFRKYNEENSPQLSGLEALYIYVCKSWSA